MTTVAENNGITGIDKMLTVNDLANIMGYLEGYTGQI